MQKHQTDRKNQSIHEELMLNITKAQTIFNTIWNSENGGFLGCLILATITVLSIIQSFEFQ